MIVTFICLLLLVCPPFSHHITLLSNKSFWFFWKTWRRESTKKKRQRQRETNLWNIISFHKIHTEEWNGNKAKYSLKFEKKLKEIESIIRALHHNVTIFVFLFFENFWLMMAKQFNERLQLQCEGHFRRNSLNGKLWRKFRLKMAFNWCFSMISCFYFVI